ncbi:DUF5682 family protein [Streptacidiphilus sp. N1-12]|uniref:DUF5682 family protein n=2 Tax=Streptacidiphilus alkalitolerans TaxID=3342712 RepID=A0ABV6WLR2_9ACTN
MDRTVSFVSFVSFVGVRHHSPACARLVSRTIESLRPAFVLVEGPSDLNGRLDELLLGHQLPIAVFSHYRDAERTATSWAPLCDYSPEWVALREGRAAGAEVRFIDLPSWHPAFADRSNRYADAEARYAEATARLCAQFSADSVDALWDRLFEVEPEAGLAERLAAYFELVRGDADADDSDRARERYMACWVRAAVAAAEGRPVLVVTGGFHRPALQALCAEEGRGEEGAGSDWPEVPAPPAGAVGGSFLVPYSFRQLDAFAGYQSGMPSPGYYQQLWDRGAEQAADGLLRAVTDRLRRRKYPVSTADLVSARVLTRGLSLLRGHPQPSRTDVLDGMASALIADDLDQPLPWTGRGRLAPGAHPVVVEMVAASSGDRVGRLHPDTPAPPLVHEVTAQLTRLGLDRTGPVALDLMSADDLTRSQVLHRLRLLSVPGYRRVAGPAHGADPVFGERWEPETPGPQAREAALIEAGAYGPSLAEAAVALLGERSRNAASAAGAGAGPEAAAGAGADGLAALLFDAVLCGAGQLSGEILAALEAGVHDLRDLGTLGTTLATALGLWRHDRVYGVARSPLLAAVVDGAVTRAMWLVEGLHGGSGSGAGAGSGADPARLRALAAVRDALLHAAPLLSLTREDAIGLALRVSRDPAAPADLRGAAVGLVWTLGGTGDQAAAVRAAADPRTLGDWLAGLFALARDEISATTGSGTNGDAGTDGAESVIDVLDGIVSELTEAEFLTALPALRLAFGYFPPRERERIAQRLLDRRGLRGSARALLRTGADPLLIARARSLEDDVTRLLDQYGLRGSS